MFYLIGWIGVIALTVTASFVGFFWGLKSGQFGDQNRARFFPLADLPPSSGRQRPLRRTAELYALGLGVLLVISALIVAIVLGTGMHL